MRHLGRKKGNALLGIFQKYLTGHPKGAAGAWMFNGCLQVLNTGLVPGNRNADNVDKIMEQFDYIVYPSESIQTDGIKAFSVTSFGFGQKGAQAIGIHPKYLYAALEHHQFAAYKQKVVETLTKATASTNTKVGVDVESISAINIENDTFIERNFTEKEIAYCQKAANPQASFTGKWSAKEAVFKSLGVKGQGAGAALKDIEIGNDETGAPVVHVSLSPTDNKHEY